MAKKKDKTEEQFAAVEETLTRSEQWVENNQKILSIFYIPSTDRSFCFFVQEMDLQRL